MPVQRIGPRDHYTLWGSALFGCPCSSQCRPHGTFRASRDGVPFASLPIWSFHGRFHDDDARLCAIQTGSNCHVASIRHRAACHRRSRPPSDVPLGIRPLHADEGELRPQESKNTSPRLPVHQNGRHPRSDGRETGNVPSRFRSPAPVGLQSGKAAPAIIRTPPVCHAPPASGASSPPFLIPRTNRPAPNRPAPPTHLRTERHAS